jgi:hypothetical protein
LALKEDEGLTKDDVLKEYVGKELYAIEVGTVGYS